MTYMSIQMNVEWHCPNCGYVGYSYSHSLREGKVYKGFLLCESCTVKSLKEEAMSECECGYNYTHIHADGSTTKGCPCEEFGTWSPKEE